MSSMELTEEASASLIEDDVSEAVDADEAEELTADEVIQRLQTAWLNEIFAPELLEPQIQVVDCLLDQIQRTEENLEKLGRGHFGLALHKMEVARIRFLIASYLRLRLEKIQKHVHHLLKSDLSKMTSEEVAYARNYKDNLNGLFENLALKHMPGKAKDFEHFGSDVSAKKGQAGPPKPNENAAVFVKVVDSVTGVFIEDEAGRGRDEEYDMEKDSLHILRYKAVAHLVQSGEVQLV